MKKYILTIEWFDGHIEIVRYGDLTLRDEGYRAYREDPKIKQVLKSEM